MAQKEENLSWFSEKKFSSLEIRKFKSISEPEIVNSVIITDTAFIEKFASRIERIPVEGDLMISFSAKAESIDLIFSGESPEQTIEVIQHGFKTPSTAFNGSTEIEKILYDEIDALLYPAFNKKIPKIKGLSIRFKDFSIEYRGQEFKDYAPVTLSFTIDHFVLKDKFQKEYPIELSAGQLPPQPVSVKINGQAIQVVTYRPGQKDRLYPDYFEVITEN